MQTTTPVATSTRRQALKSGALLLAGLAGAPAILAQKNSSDPGSSNRPLSGKVAIVTGARDNIGRGIAVGLGALGADVVVHYHRADTVDQAKETARLAREAGAAKVSLAEGDLGDGATVKRMFDLAERELGGIDIFVHNAGRAVRKPFVDLTDEDYRSCWNINEWAAFLCMREAARRLRPHGRIINIITALVPGIVPGNAAYVGPKAANAELCRVLAAELGRAPRFITVNSVHPGPLDTDFFHDLNDPASATEATNRSPAKRLGTVADIVPMVQFLASPGAQWVSGESLYVAGATTQA